LWDQIDKAITDPATCDAWAILLTKNSLESEACQEELAYALDRALRSREFPLIGIFTEPIDRSLIPSAIATRLYVTLQDPQWAAKVADGASNRRTQTDAAPLLPYHVQLHKAASGGTVLEVRPRSGRWYPFLAAVPAAERSSLLRVEHGPFGALPGATITSQNDFTVTENQSGQVRVSGIRMSHAITNLHSAFVWLADPPPSLLYVGMVEETYEIKLR
jgi:hypothetical protein